MRFETLDLKEREFLEHRLTFHENSRSKGSRHDHLEKFENVGGTLFMVRGLEYSSYFLGVEICDLIFFRGSLGQERTVLGCLENT